ncbi:MAG TPA: efflux RND transporter periplasmic adaptor subunit [Candidatus Binatia bacterium]|nr:efflux RND transporter periplasmic adaptor subunit [Candidatus Binatia bacterium]
MKRYSWLFVVLALAAAFVGYRVLSPGTLPWRPARFPQEGATSVRVGVAKTTTIAPAVHGTGEIRPVTEIDLVASMAGRIAAIRARVGDPVSEGDIVATLKAEDLLERARQIAATLERAETDLRDQETVLEERVKRLERARELHRRELIAGVDVSAAEAAAETERAHRDLMRARVEQHRAALAQARALLPLSKLAAPLTGVVTRRLVETGGSVERGTPVVTIGALDPMSITMDIPATQAESVRKGLPAQLKAAAFPGRVFSGKVAAVRSPQVGMEQAAVAEILIANPDRLLKPGMAVSASLLLGEKRDAILLPRQAVGEIAGKRYVYTVVNNKAQRRWVVTGQNYNGEVEITGGLRVGETVVLEDPRSIKPDSDVRIADGRPGP